MHFPFTDCARRTVGPARLTRNERRLVVACLTYIHYRYSATACASFSSSSATGTRSRYIAVNEILALSRVAHVGYQLVPVFRQSFFPERNNCQVGTGPTTANRLAVFRGGAAGAGAGAAVAVAERAPFMLITGGWVAGPCDSADSLLASRASPFFLSSSSVARSCWPFSFAAAPHAGPSTICH